MSIWNLPSWDECSESSTHDASSTPKSKEHASDSDACSSHLNVQSTTAGSIMHASKCSQLRQIHEKFESLRLQLDAERRPPPPQRWPPNQASQLLRRASAPVHTINTTASSLPPRQDVSSFSTSTTHKPGAADTQHAQTQTIATSLHHLSSTHVGTTTSDMQPSPPPHVPTWVKEQEVPLNHFQDMWHDKVQALDDMLGTLSSQIQQQSDAAALTMYLAWLAGTMQATLPLAKMTTWHDNSTTVTLSSNSPKVPANSAAATDMIEASLSTLVQDYRSLHSTHTAAMHHAKHSWSKKLHKAVHDTATTHAKWEHALATIHLLQDERNVLQTELHGALKRTAAVEKDLLTCQLKVSTLEQQCRDLHDQLRLQEIAWKEELAKAHPPPPTPPQATSFESSSKNLDIPVVPLAITMNKKQPIKVHEDCPETIWPEEAVQNEWWIDDGGNSDEDERGPPVPRPVNLPPPIAPREPPASTPHFGGRHHRQHQHISTHRHMLLEYLHKAASSKHPPPRRRLKDQERGYESLAQGSK